VNANAEIVGAPQDETASSVWAVIENLLGRYAQLQVFELGADVVMGPAQLKNDNGRRHDSRTVGCLLPVTVIQDDYSEAIETSN
jgi:hypothetical protein